MSQDRDKWNTKHQSSLGMPLARPALWLERQADLLATVVSGASEGKARALDVACGRGRNAVYLAELGFQVDAMDISEVAVADLEGRARREKLTIRAQTVDLTVETPAESTYELVIVFRYLAREIMPSLELALKPGGFLIYETFVASSTSVSSMNPSFLLKPAELPGLFPALETLAYEESDPGPEARDRPTARLLAQRPA